jgi:hypothetical protein
MLNADQWRSTIAGDLFCTCHNNNRGNKPYAYFWKHEERHKGSATAPKKIVIGATDDGFEYANVPESAPLVETPTKEAYEGMAQGNASPEPLDTTGRPESTGFEVLVKIHTKDADQKLHSPELLRFLVGKVIDSRYRLEEEIDYTLEVKRVYR